MRLPHHAAHLFAHIGVRHIDRLRDQAHPFFMATVPAALHDLVHVIRAVIVVDQRDLPDLVPANMRAAMLGEKPSSAIAASTFALVAALT